MPKLINPIKNCSLSRYNICCSMYRVYRNKFSGFRHANCVFGCFSRFCPFFFHFFLSFQAQYKTNRSQNKFDSLVGFIRRRAESLRERETFLPPSFRNQTAIWANENYRLKYSRQEEECMHTIFVIYARFLPSGSTYFLARRRQWSISNFPLRERRVGRRGEGF